MRAENVLSVEERRGDGRKRLTANESVYMCLNPIRTRLAMARDARSRRKPSCGYL